ncbi:hypothetical protein MBLNU459_g6092t2 [Dothideomycetes sp. NU459]
MRTQFLLASILPLASAHFNLVYPAARGFDEDTLGTFPCGGQNTVSTNRTQWPLSGAPIQLDMGHTSAKVQVLLALGNEPGDNFNITLVPTFDEQGPQNFCIAGAAIRIPAGLNIAEGTNATIQVVTNGDPSGGLYNVHITFTSTLLSTAEYSSNCQNSTGVSAKAITDNTVNANSSSSSTTSSSTSSASGTSAGSATAAASATSTSAGAAAQATLAGFALGAIGVLVGVAAL